MARFDKVAKLAYECFKDKAGYMGYVKVNKKDNYIGVVTCDCCGDIITDMTYDPRQKFARIMTFDSKHREENLFSDLLKKLKIKSEIELCKRTLAASVFAGFLPQSPSGRAEDELMEEMRRMDALDMEEYLREEDHIPLTQ
jgi:hypothetical protein